jgi:hypothetical protein
MGRRIWWPARLGLLGLCLIWAGCGDSDIPDPESDSHVATESTTLPITSNPAPAPAEEKSTEPAAAPAEPAPAEAVAKAEPAPAESPSRWPKLEETASKATQVALAEKTTKPAETRPAVTASAPPATPDTTAAQEAATDAASLSNFPDVLNSASPTPNPAQTSLNPSANSGTESPTLTPTPTLDPGSNEGSPTRPANPQAPNTHHPNPSARPKSPGNVSPNPPGNSGNVPPSSPGGAGNGVGLDQQVNFHTPVGAVLAFLNALKVKDPEALKEATALRSPAEAKPRNRDLFSAILEKSLTEEDLNELATKLEGFQIVDMNQAVSTGRRSVMLMKPGKNGSRLIRTITARHEKAGWKVVDISGQGELENPSLIPRGFGMGRRGGRR